MQKPQANHPERSALLRCVMLLVALGLPAIGVTAAAATFGADEPREAEILDDIALEALASPIALYPDELLAIILPAATFPLQIVQAARFLEARQSDPRLEPDDAWDDTVVALLNYPEALALLDSDLAWTERLGDAVITQEAALMRAVSQFRERAYNAGNLRSDERQQVSRNAEVIAINTAATDSVYVPYYNPSAMIVPQAAPVYHYYSNPYPLYYYPYSPQHHYLSSAFWGLTAAYTLSWATHRIRIHRHDYHSHPYYQERYYRPRYRDRAAPWPRSAFNARRQYPRNYIGDAWRSGGRHEKYRRPIAGKPARIASDPRPGDRIRKQRQTPGPASVGGSSSGFRASNGLLGNGAFTRPQTPSRPRAPTAVNRNPAAIGTNARGSAVAAKPSAPTRQHDGAKNVVPLQVRAQEFVDRRRASQSRPAPVANRTATEERRPRNPARNARSATSRQTDRSAARGNSSRANATRNPGTPGAAYRDNAGGRTRAGGGFLGNGNRSRSRR